MSNPERDALVQAATGAREQAYARYSGFRVGAAVRTGDGRIVTGGNVENASFGLAMCAERVAIHAAVADGEKDFTAIAIVSQGGAAPCGACRQVLAEFCDELTIYLVDADDPAAVRETSLAVLLPERFDGSGLQRDP